MDGQHLRAAKQARYRGKILEWIVTDILVDRGRNNHRTRRSDEERITVGFRGSDRFRTDRAAGTSGTIFNNKRLAEGRRQPFRKNAYDSLRRAARRRRYDQPDQPGWIGLVCGRLSQRGANPEREYGKEQRVLSGHASPILFLRAVRPNNQTDELLLPHARGQSLGSIVLAQARWPKGRNSL